MDNNPVSGGQKQPSCGSQLDFVNYWADQTVKEAVLRGTQLRQEKPHALPVREYDVVNIDFIKPPCSTKNFGYRRKKSPKKFTKRHTSRSTSPYCQGSSPTRPAKLGKRQTCQKAKTKPPCGMRIAELAVPTKRQCLDTWRNKCNTLPAYMIERLRQHVLDQSPVVQISDAIYCFKRKYKKEKKPERSVDKTSGKYLIKNIKKPLWENEVKTLSAIFGHKIAKKLYTSLNIILNSELQKIANVVSNDIENLMCKSKKIGVNNRMNQIIHTDITKKVTIWISDVLDEAAYKILEDQIEDFEEEAGPVLDFIDDLVDGVLDICIPKPEVFEELSTSESFGAGLEEEGILELQLEISGEKVGLEDVSLIEGDTVLETDVHEKIEDHLKNEINIIINNIDKEADTRSDEYLDIDDGPGWQSSEDAEANDIDMKTDEYLESEDRVALQLNANVEANDSDIKIDEYLESEDGAALQNDNDNAEATVTDIINDEYVESEDGVALQQSEYAEATAINNDEYVESDGVAEKPSVNAEISIENAENIVETFIDATDENKGDENLPDPNQQIDDILIEPSQASIDGNNKKVTFTEMATDAEEISASVENLGWKESVDRMEFAPPNEDLLSDADESWPDEKLPPVIRPSQSVSKSITSLGKINEDEEKASVLPDRASHLGQEGEKDTTLTAVAENIVPPSKKGSEEIEAQTITEYLNLEEPIKATADNAQAKSLGTSDRGDKVDDKLRKTGKVSKELKKTGVIAAAEKEKRISESKLGKPPVKKATTITKQNNKKYKITVEITQPPKRISKTDNNARKSKERTSIPKKSKDITSAGTSKSVKDLGEVSDGVGKVKEDKLTRVKLKPDYRVNANTAPAWISRKYGEPSCSCVNIPSTCKVMYKMNGNEIRRWCRDLEQGYENLKMWNDWVDNTSRTVCMLQQEIGGLECPQRCENKEWMKLKKNIDKDASLWRKLNQNTRERLKCYRKMYQKRSEIPSNYRIMCERSQPK